MYYLVQLGNWKTLELLTVPFLQINGKNKFEGDLIINNECKSMVLSILRWCFSYANDKTVHECECTNGTYASYYGLCYV